MRARIITERFFRKKNYGNDSDCPSLEDKDIFKVSLNKKKRTIDVIGDICQEMIFEIKNALDELASSGQNEAKIYINSSGGDAHAGLAIYDLFKSAPFTVITVCIGECYSAGLIIFLGGDERIMYPNSYLTLHELTLGRVSMEDLQEKDIDTLSNSVKKLNKLMIGIIKKNCSLDPEKIRALYYSETMFVADEALECGLCTKIIENRKNQ